MIYSSLYPIPERCDVCKSKQVDFVHVSELRKTYNSEWPYMYYCRNCEAAVGCHKGTKRPLGRMADKHVRRLRKLVHGYFDKIWLSGLMERQTAYFWLAEKLGISRACCHFGMMRSRHLREAIDICKAFLKEHTGKAKIKKDKENERRIKRKQRQSKQYEIKRAERETNKSKRLAKQKKRRRSR